VLTWWIEKAAVSIPNFNVQLDLGHLKLVLLFLSTARYSLLGGHAWGNGGFSLRGIYSCTSY
jgi:hypothetical protein